MGHSFGKLTSSLCSETRCSCSERLKTGSIIAQEIRSEIFQCFGITTSCGISYNKILSKIVGSQNKPNKQTTLFPSNSKELLLGLDSFKKIPGVGSSAIKVLQENNLKVPKDVLDISYKEILQLFPDSPDTGIRVKKLCEGIDNSIVKDSNDKPLSIGLEDRFKCITTKIDVEKKMRWLLRRLNNLLIEDGRTPRTLKVSARDWLKDRIQGNHKFRKESRQCKINPQLFRTVTNEKQLEPSDEIITIVMGLVEKIVDFENSFELTLLGVSVTDFVIIKRSISSFFIDNDNDKVIEAHKSEISCSSNNHKQSQTNSHIGRFSDGTAAKSMKLYSTEQNMSSITSSMGEISQTDTLRTTNGISRSNDMQTNIPENWDTEVFLQLPQEIQKELLGTNDCKAGTAERQVSNIPVNVTPIKHPHTILQAEVNRDILPCEWDTNVFYSLPQDVRKELLTKNVNNSVPKSKKRAPNRIENYFTKKLSKEN